MDGSYHTWFEEREGWFTLVSMVDDATNTTLAILSEIETTESALQLLWKWIESYGIPQSLYTDRHSVSYGITGEQEKTQFGRACQELGIRIICAITPSKGVRGEMERDLPRPLGQGVEAARYEYFVPSQSIHCWRVCRQAE